VLRSMPLSAISKSANRPRNSVDISAATDRTNANSALQTVVKLGLEGGLQASTLSSPFKLTGASLPGYMATSRSRTGSTDQRGEWVSSIFG